MQDKGYDHPLYSLDLLPGAAELKSGADYTLPVSQGQLVVSRALLRRAAACSSALCLGALQVALAHHVRAEDVFSTHGLSVRWAAALSHWGGELRARERLREPVLEQLAALFREQRAALRTGHALWRRLILISELGGMTGQIVSGRPPRAELAFIDALSRCGACLAAPDVAKRLRPFGLSPELLAEIQGLAADLWARRRRIAEAEAARARLSGAIAVIRGALVGDLARLCRVAAVVLLPEQRAALRMERMFSAPAA